MQNYKKRKLVSSRSGVGPYQSIIPTWDALQKRLGVAQHYTKATR